MGDLKLQLTWHGKPQGFGEALMIARVVSILRDNGLDVIFQEKVGTAGLTDCFKIPYGANPRDYGYTIHRWQYTVEDTDPIVVQYVKHYEEVFGRKIEITRDCCPVLFNRMEVPSYDVVLQTETGNWTPYREWPYFSELKEMFNKHGISYLDLSNPRVVSMEYLNYVNNAKLYVGLDTGPAHYVSSVAKNKALIIQGGFITYDYWAYLYKFDHIQVEDVPCRPCFINRIHIQQGKACQHNHRCMREISPQEVFYQVERMLNDR